MSDLAPFVAAVLRDKTTMDLQEELNGEKEKVKKLEGELQVMMIRITGPGGSPVYAQRHFQYAKKEDDILGEDWYLNLENSTGNNANPNLASCPVQDIDKCEMHIGGKEIVVIGDYDEIEDMSIIRDTDCELLYLFQRIENNNHKMGLTLELGPNPDPEALETLEPIAYRNAGITYVRFKEFQASGHPFAD